MQQPLWLHSSTLLIYILYVDICMYVHTLTCLTKGGLNVIIISCNCIELLSFDLFHLFLDIVHLLRTSLL
jgi:hypothetical protein